MNQFSSDTKKRSNETDSKLEPIKQNSKLNIGKRFSHSVRRVFSQNPEKSVIERTVSLNSLGNLEPTPFCRQSSLPICAGEKQHFIQKNHYTSDRTSGQALKNEIDATEAEITCQKKISTSKRHLKSYKGIDRYRNGSNQQFLTFSYEGITSQLETNKKFLSKLLLCQRDLDITENTLNLECSKNFLFHIYGTLLGSLEIHKVCRCYDDIRDCLEQLKRNALSVDCFSSCKISVSEIDMKVFSRESQDLINEDVSQVILELRVENILMVGNMPRSPRYLFMVYYEPERKCIRCHLFKFRTAKQSADTVRAVKLGFDA